MKEAGKIALVSFLLLLCCAGSLCADPRDQFARETGLDIDLVNLVKVDIGGVELTVVFVFITERTFQSKISPALRAALQPYVGRNAFYVNPSIEQVVDRFDFTPHGVLVEQAGVSFAPPADAWVEITPGFLDGRFEVNPSGPSQGSGSEGIVVLGEAIDSGEPLDMIYLGQRARFDIGAAPAYTYPTTGTTALPPEIAPMDDVMTIEGLLAEEGFSDEAMASLFGLDLDLVRTMHFSQRDEDLRLFFVRLEESVRESELTPELLTAIDPLIGTGAIMVWAFSTTGAAFSPWHLYVFQGANYPIGLFTNPFVELTDGFSRSVLLDPGTVAAGAFRLPGGVDGSLPFTVFYGSTGVDYP